MSNRLTAEERREEIVAAAAIEFATTGYSGTSTETIAARAGVSQPYLFQLFGTKKGLFLATVQDTFERAINVFEETGKKARAEGLGSEETLHRMGHAYLPLLIHDRQMLQLQLQAYAASCRDPEIQAVVRRAYLDLCRRVAETAGANPQQLHEWLAEGMLLNVVASISDVTSEEEVWGWLFGAMPVDK